MRFSGRSVNSEIVELPLVFGHFLPWFTLRGADYPLPVRDAQPLDFIPDVEDFRHWNDPRSGYRRTHHHIPAIGLYDSRNPDVIEWQIRTALEYGLDGFILNWYGKHSVENVITLHWLNGLERWNAAHTDRPFHYFFSVDMQALSPTEGKRPVSMEEDFTYIKEHLLRDTYLHRDGLPVFSVFQYETPCDPWRRALDAVFGPGGADLIWRGSSAKGADACYAWIQPDEDTIDLGQPCCWTQPNSAGDGFLREFLRGANAGLHQPDYLMTGVWPGFNNQFVSWAWSPDPNHPHIRPCVICRETTRGNTLDLTWRAYMDYLARWIKGGPDARIPAPLIQLCTWNDYAETTTLEPTRDYGTAPLELCRVRTLEARTLWRSQPAPQISG